MSARERLRGLRGARGKAGLLVRTRSVHTFGIDRDLLVVFLDRSGAVLSATVVPPRRFASNRRARWTLELDADIQPPPCGLTLELLTRS